MRRDKELWLQIIDELTQTIAEQAQQVRAGALSARALTERALARIKASEPALNAYARLREQQALECAEQLDRRRLQASPDARLYGVPIAIKDLFYLRGELAAAGTRVLRDFRPSYTASVVQRLQAAGAVIVGQTQLTEGAYGAHHPDLATPINPWHADYWCGVSSSGSGVTVAAGAVAASLGTDTGGSIRFPAAANGVVGLKPTYGRVSTFGSLPLAPSLDHIGPLTRSVSDAATMLAVISGPDRRDPHARNAGFDPATIPALPRLTGVRVGIDWRYCEAGVESAVVDGVRLAAKQLTALGAELCEVSLPKSAAELIRGWGSTCSFETEQIHRARYARQREDFGPALSSLIEIGCQTSVADYAALARTRQAFSAELQDLFNSVTLLLMPNMPVVAALETAMRSAPDPRQASFITFTAPFNYCGHPTLSLPIDTVTVDWRRNLRMPRTVQLVAGWDEEPMLLAVGAALERAFAFDYGALRA